MGLWKLLKEQFNEEEVDMEESFYCGDAAGRQKDWTAGKKKVLKSLIKANLTNCCYRTSLVLIDCLL